jgi:subtilase family serine protease
MVSLLCGSPARGWSAGGATTAYAAPAPPSIAACRRRYHRPCLTPSQIYAAYGIDALFRRGIRGQGRTICILVSYGSPTLDADLRTFDRAFGLPDPILNVLAPLGMHAPTDRGWAGETTLDVEWAHAIAPDARIVVLESPVSETEGVRGLPEFLALGRYALDHHLADVLSQSWGATEGTLLDAAGRKMVAALHHLYGDAARRGVTVVAASGDEGAAGIDLSLRRYFPSAQVGFPASDPLVLAVGGTQLSLSAGGAATSEQAWPGSGGGFSSIFAEPAYQRTLPAAVQGILRGRRGVPDVAYDASARSPILIYLGGRWRLAAGTSAAAPQWAGLAALADGLAGRDLGPLAPLLYRLAASPRYAADLRDITHGSSVGPLRGGTRLGGIGFPALPGWDAVTGLGTPRAASLIPDLVRLAKDSGHQ